MAQNYQSTKSGTLARWTITWLNILISQTNKKLFDPFYTTFFSPSYPLLQIRFATHCKAWKALLAKFVLQKFPFDVFKWEGLIYAMNTFSGEYILL